VPVFAASVVNGLKTCPSVKGGQIFLIDTRILSGIIPHPLISKSFFRIFDIAEPQ
jgi:hypothetical protein